MIKIRILGITADPTNKYLKMSFYSYTSWKCMYFVWICYRPFQQNIFADKDELFDQKSNQNQNHVGVFGPVIGSLNPSFLVSGCFGKLQGPDIFLERKLSQYNGTETDWNQVRVFGPVNVWSWVRVVRHEVIYRPNPIVK